LADSELPVRLICATRLPPERFLQDSLTGRSVSAYSAASPAEIHLCANNSTGLPEIYNGSIEAARDNPALLVFVHDDVFLQDYFWAGHLRSALNTFDIIGVAGNRRRQPLQAMWSLYLDASTGTLKADDAEHLSGAVAHGSVFPPRQLDYFGPPGVECKLLDGLLLAADSRTLIRSGLRFDPQFRFHFYDMDFCREAERLGLRMGTAPLSVVHASGGSMNDDWRTAFGAYLRKWQQ